MKIVPVNYDYTNQKNNRQQKFGANLKNVEVLVDSAQKALGNDKSKAFFNRLERILKRVNKMLLSTGENANVELYEGNSTRHLDEKDCFKKLDISFTVKSTPLKSNVTGYANFLFDNDLSARKLANNFKEAIRKSLDNIEKSDDYVNESLHKKAKELDEMIHPQNTNSGTAMKK